MDSRNPLYHEAEIKSQMLYHYTQCPRKKRQAGEVAEPLGDSCGTAWSGEHAAISRNAAAKNLQLSVAYDPALFHDWRGFSFGVESHVGARDLIDVRLRILL